MLIRTDTTNCATLTEKELSQRCAVVSRENTEAQQMMMWWCGICVCCVGLCGLRGLVCVCLWVWCVFHSLSTNTDCESARLFNHKASCDPFSVRQKTVTRCVRLSKMCVCTCKVVCAHARCLWCARGVVCVSMQRVRVYVVRKQTAKAHGHWTPLPKDTKHKIHTHPTKSTHTEHNIHAPRHQTHQFRRNTEMCIKKLRNDTHFYMRKFHANQPNLPNVGVDMRPC